MNNFGECLGDAGWQPFSDCCAFAFTEAFPGCGCSKWSQKGFYTECKYNLMGEDFDSLEGCAAVQVFCRFNFHLVRFGLCQELELDGDFTAADGALTEIFGLVQMEQKFQIMPTGSEEENPDQ